MSVPGEERTYNAFVSTLLSLCISTLCDLWCFNISQLFISEIHLLLFNLTIFQHSIYSNLTTQFMSISTFNCRSFWQLIKVWPNIQFKCVPIFNSSAFQNMIQVQFKIEASSVSVEKWRNNALIFCQWVVKLI